MTRIHAVSSVLAIVAGIAMAWGCSDDDNNASTPNSSDDGGASSSGSSGSSGASTSSGGTSSSSGGASSSSGDASSPDPNPVMLASGIGVGQLQAIGARGFAKINDGATGVEEWSTDFTKAGTKILVDACGGACSGDPRPLSALPNGTLFFAAKTSQSVVQANAIYASDGTAAGTVKLPNSGGMPAVVVGANVIFRSTNTSVAISDGTAAGTSSLKNLSPHFFGQETDSISLGDRGLFTMLEDPGGGGSFVRRIYGTDGTANGTVLVTGGQFIDYLVRVDGNIAFLASDNFAPGQFLGTTTIIVTDGTAAGTKTLSISGGGSFLTTPGLGNETAVGAAMYFTGKANGAASSALYKADSNAVTKVADTYPSNMVAFSNKATFISGATKFMQTDGTTPVEIYDAASLTDAGSPAYPSNLTPSANGTTLWFTLGAALWKLEGSSPAVVATKIASFVNDCPACSATASSSTRLYISSGGTRIFVLRTFTEQDQTKRPSAMWFSDGTTAGTKLLQASGATELVPTPTGVMWTNGTELWHERP